MNLASVLWPEMTWRVVNLWEREADTRELKFPLVKIIITSPYLETWIRSRKMWLLSNRHQRRQAFTSTEQNVKSSWKTFWRSPCQTHSKTSLKLGGKKWRCLVHLSRKAMHRIHPSCTRQRRAPEGGETTSIATFSPQRIAMPKLLYPLRTSSCSAVTVIRRSGQTYRRGPVATGNTAGCGWWTRNKECSDAGTFCLSGFSCINSHSPRVHPA